MSLSLKMMLVLYLNILKRFLIEEISEMEVVSKLPISQLTIDVTEIKKGLANVKKAIQSQTEDPEDKVKEVLTPHEETVTQAITEMEVNIKALEEIYLKCATFFCENPKDTSEKFGDKLIKMMRSIQRAKQDKAKYAEIKRKEEEKKRKEEEKQKKDEEKKQKELEKKQKDQDKSKEDVSQKKPVTHVQTQPAQMMTSQPVKGGVGFGLNAELMKKIQQRDAPKEVSKQEVQQGKAQEQVECLIHNLISAQVTEPYAEKQQVSERKKSQQSISSKSEEEIDNIDDDQSRVLQVLLKSKLISKPSETFQGRSIEKRGSTILSNDDIKELRNKKITRENKDKEGGVNTPTTAGRSKFAPS